MEFNINHQDRLKDIIEGIPESTSSKIILEDETKEYRNSKSEFHRDNDKPAIICCDGTLYWYQNGLCHRDMERPAVVGYCGTAEYWKNGVIIKGGLLY